MKNIKLNALAQQNLDNKEMNTIKGGAPGDPCCCGCMYQYQGGSTVMDNFNANVKLGLRSPNCNTV